MSPLQNKLISTAREQYQFKDTEEFVELFKSTKDVDKLRGYFKALEDAYSETN